MRSNDVGLGTRVGVTFVPPHLAEDVVRRAEDARARDVFGKARIAKGVSGTGQSHVPVRADDIEADGQAGRAVRHA